ncbi:MAG TPA: hypothetical protein ENK31_09575 [Nannocystis exedens]|nr:hypothetical protein [Nannocystis exedens]
MENASDGIEFGAEYISGPKASTDLHAGGIFFCTPYHEILTFSADGRVCLRRRVIEFFRPMNGQSEIDSIEQFEMIGEYHLNSRGYIECTFDRLTMVGLPLNEHPEILTFHCTTKAGGYAHGSAYSRARE